MAPASMAHVVITRESNGMKKIIYEGEAGILWRDGNNYGTARARQTPLFFLEERKGHHFHYSRSRIYLRNTGILNAR